MSHAYVNTSVSAAQPVSYDPEMLGAVLDFTSPGEF
jgi:hypothetical protein